MRRQLHFKICSMTQGLACPNASLTVDKRTISHRLHARFHSGRPVAGHGAPCVNVAKPQPEPSTNARRAAVSPAQTRQQSKQTKRKDGVLEAKRALQFATAGTFRGGLITPTQRAVVEEAIIDLEAFGREVDFQQLQGLWRLIYTTALDVAPLVRPADTFSPVRIGNVYQRFGTLESGLCQNIIKASVPFLLEEGDGVTFCVGVKYEASSPRRISLRFQEAGFSDVHITSLTEALIAPAILPRGWIQQQILLAIKEANLKVPLPFASRQGRSGVGEYLLSFLDETMLVGRAQNGTFVFIREH
ncbi:TPA: hypothetical protein ACH3X2_005606 [Trebouxia sp. C0005]